MARASDRELIDRWKGESAPLLPLLHAFHERDGWLTEEAIREVTARAIRRLDLFEYVILGGAAVLALAAGALAALVVAQAFGAPFRTSWAVASLTFFVVPAIVARLRSRSKDEA